ncbi:NAD(P)-binding protein [Hygrophoropsis aurantiaca]|uniref:NAD(P)-binding protein n=1 Tax=Hygrophoropsis aurantiaca TaxID=72124 RepID=A0ACB8A1P1_9AGAM|nr:NAD(P)-binding protein [Hygrophoropsis aurantiaca]
MSPLIWFITGASSGFGRSMTELALSLGDIVVATLRKPEVLDGLTSQYPTDKLLVLKLDVTNQVDIDQAFETTKAEFGRIDIVFNNAGLVMMGELEGFPIDIARNIFEVNFWGASNVSLAAVKFFREVNGPEKGGILLQNSSASGFIPPPCFGYYSARQVIYHQTRTAIEGFTEGLAKELSPNWNIKVCIIQPGAFHTHVMDAAQLLPPHPAYIHETSSAAYHIRDIVPTAEFQGDPEKFVRTLYKVATGGDIPLHLPMGMDAVVTIRAKAEKIIAGVNAVESWSANLKRDDGGQEILVPV